MTLDLFVKPREMTVLRMCRKESCNEEYMALPYGGKIAVEEVHEMYGGGAQNTAVGLTRLGVSATPIGSIGSDAWSEQILKNLGTEGIATKYIARTKHQTGFSVILNSFEGERTVLTHAGANKLLHSFDETILTHCDGLFFNHISAENHATEEIFAKIKRHFLKFPEKFLAWNPGTEQLHAGAMAFADFFPTVDLLLLNREEAELFSGHQAGNRESILNGAVEEFPQSAADYSEIFRVFLRQGVKHVAITDGRRGAELCDGKKIYFCGIDETAARVDTLGAGDAFGSTLLWALITKKQLPFALKCATINAAAVVSQIGAEAGLLSEQDLLAREKNTPILELEIPFVL